MSKMSKMSKRRQKLSWGQGGNCRSVPANEYNYRNICGMRGDIAERLLMSWNHEQEAEELATHGFFGVSTAKCVTFISYGTGQPVRYCNIVVCLVM